MRKFTTCRLAPGFDPGIERSCIQIYAATRQLGRIFARHALLSTVTPKNVNSEGFMTDIEEVENQGEVVPEHQAQDSMPDDNSPLARDVVSKIVERERKKAYEKGQKDALMQSQQEQQASQAQQPMQQAPVINMQGQAMQQPQMNQADIERMIAEKAPQLLHDHVQNLKNEHTINSFVSKMQAAEQKHPGLEAKLNELDYTSMAPLVHLANDMENTGDIMKELVDNPMKLANMMALAQMQPGIAKRQMAELSNSIKTNQEALSQEKQAQDPMSQLKPSSSAGMDNGTMSVNDFRKMFRS